VLRKVTDGNNGIICDLFEEKGSLLSLV